MEHEKRLILERIELVLSGGIASIEENGADKDGEVLLRYLDVQNKIGEIVWDKIATLLTPHTEQ